MNNYQKLKTQPAKKPRRGFYYSCETCGKEFYVWPSRVRDAAKRNTRIRFCSMACRNPAYRGAGNPMWGKKHTPEAIKKMSEHPNRSRFPKGKTNPTYYRLNIPPTSASSRGVWRKFLLAKRSNRCEQCGYKQHPIIQLHHKDSDATNNIESNLKLLCPTCHEAVHYLIGTGRYGNPSGRRGRS